jgi:hypothetical protein
MGDQRIRIQGLIPHLPTNLERPRIPHTPARKQKTDINIFQKQRNQTTCECIARRGICICDRFRRACMTAHSDPILSPALCSPRSFGRSNNAVFVHPVSAFRTGRQAFAPAPFFTSRPSRTRRANLFGCSGSCGGDGKEQRGKVGWVGSSMVKESIMNAHRI